MAQFLGTVIGTKMDKTVKVLVTRMSLHPKLQKVIFSNLMQTIWIDQQFDRAL